ncbi:MAG: HNH endonuclease signature motif containing protein [Acidithiobacillus sp.]|nr:HNH endonuclease signature motif containing protein [Acidithiobacillus sp.]
MSAVKALRAAFDYNPVTGIFTWKKHKCANYTGKKAGCLHKPTGYWFLTLNNKKVKGHIAAWAIYYGIYPTHHIDHKNLNKSDNRITNLRKSNKSKNGANRPAQKNNTSGHKGVFWMKRAKGWLVQIGVRGTVKYVGFYKQKEDAIAAYAAAANRYHGEFARAA